MPGEGAVAAVSGDGVTEAVEFTGKYFAVGIQWHPEMMADSDEQQKFEIG